MKDTVLTLVRHLLTFLGSLGVTAGVIEADSVPVIAGALVVIFTAVWEYFATGKLSAAAKASG